MPLQRIWLAHGACNRVVLVKENSASSFPGTGRLADQIGFLVEIDKLKTVLRQNLISDGSRQENTGEHSWHLAMCALILAEYANEPVDVGVVIKMLLLHDLVEIDAGDTFVYASAEHMAAQDGKEQLAAERIFGLLPIDQAAQYRALWDEFEAKESVEAKFAKAVDRLQPMLLNLASGGGSWEKHGITADRPLELINRTIPPGSEVLAQYAREVIQRSVEVGALLPFAEIVEPV
jgi:putative hydrolases of HD superfamily